MSCCKEKKTCKTCQYYSTGNIPVICSNCIGKEPKRIYTYWEPKTIEPKYICRSYLKIGTTYVVEGPNNTSILAVFLCHSLQSGLLELLKGKFVIVGSESQPIVTELTYENWQFSLPV